MNVGTLTISLTARTAALLSSLTKVRTFEKGVLASVQRMNRNIGTVGQSLSILSLPLIGIGALAMKSFSEFEYAMAKTTGLAGVASKQVQAWTKDVLRIAQKTGESAQDLAEGLYFVASSGIHGAKVLETVEVAAYGAMSGLGKTKDIANLLTSVMNAYGIANVNVAGTMDILVAAVKEGKAEADDMAKSLGMVVNVASELGISFANVASAVAATTRTGVSTNTSATQLRQFLFSFVKERPMVEDALRSMGLTFEEVRKSLSDDLLTGLIKLRAVTSAWGDAALAQVIPNVRAFNEALSLTGVNVIETMKLFKAIKTPTNAFATAVSAVADTSRVKLRQSMQTVTTSLINFGAVIADDVIKIVEKFTNFISKLVGWFTSLDGGTQSLILTITALSAVLGPMLLVLSSFISSVLSMASALFTPLGALLAIAAAITLVSRNFEFWEKAWPRIMITIGVGFTKIELRLLKLKDTLLGVTETIRDFLVSNLGDVFGNAAAAAITPAALTTLNLVSEAEERKKRIAEIESDIVMMEEALASRPDLQYGFMDALGDSLEVEGKKILDWVTGFTKDLGTKFSGVPKLNIGDGGMTTLDFLDYAIDELDLMEYKAKIQDLTNLQAELAKTFGVSGLIAGAGNIASLSNLNEYLNKVNKEMVLMLDNAKTLEDLDALKNFITNLPQGIKDLMDPETFLLFKESIDLQTKSIIAANEKLAAYTNTNWKFSEMGKDVLDVSNSLIHSFAEFGATIDLIGNKKGLGTDAMNAQISYWQNLKQAAIDAVTAMRLKDKDIEIPKEVLDSYNLAVDKLNKLQNTKFTIGMGIANSIVSATEDMLSLGDTIKSVFEDGKVSFKEFVNLVSSGLSFLTSLFSMIKVIREATTVATLKDIAATGAGIPVTLAAAAAQETLAVANTNVAITGAAASTSWIPIVGVGLAIAGVLALLAVLTSKKQKVAKMANGGVVPPGYPNDTYPALLSSGEKIVPPGKLPNFENDFKKSASKKLRLDGEWRIKGRDLYYIIKEEERRIGNAF